MKNLNDCLYNFVFGSILEKIFDNTNADVYHLIDIINKQDHLYEFFRNYNAQEHLKYITRWK